MTEPNVWIFAIPTQLNGMFDTSGIPKSATIFYHENRWWYELKTGQAFTNELSQRKNNFNKIRTVHNGLDFASGPFDFESVDIEIALSEQGNRHLYSITSINGRQLERPIQRTRSPIAAINLVGEAIKDAVKLPPGATHRCWLNGSDIIENGATDTEPNEVVMLLMGGLAYLDSDHLHNCRVIQINRFHFTENGRFKVTKSAQWKSEFTQTLLDQDRFTSCLILPFIEADVRHYAFINPSEELTSSNDPKYKWIPTLYGAFLYLFNDDKSPNNRDCLYELSPDVLGVSASSKD